MVQSMNETGGSIARNSCTEVNGGDVWDPSDLSDPDHNDCSKKCSNSPSSSIKTNHGGENGKVMTNVPPDSISVRLQNGASTSRCKLECNVEKVQNGTLELDESSSGNEGEEDCCFYMYKGSLQADLPSSFHKLERIANGSDGGVEENGEVANNSRSRACSSPDNEFLEMDFDPEPSLEQDSDDESSGSNVEEIAPQPENDLNGVNKLIVEPALSVNNVSTSRDFRNSPLLELPSTSSRSSQDLPNLHLRGQSSSNVFDAQSDLWRYHRSSGDLCSPCVVDPTLDNYPEADNSFWAGSGFDDSGDHRKRNLFSDFYHRIMAKRLVMEKNAALPDVAKISDAEGKTLTNEITVDRTMIWSEQEACMKQVTQISTSACGATALINVMLALNIPFNKERLLEGVGTRLRAKLSAPLPEYLFSRSVAGATHHDLICGAVAATEGRLFGRFFAMHPPRKVALSRFLAHWMQLGAVPILTLNLQEGNRNSGCIADAWHHQMVFGVSSRGIYLTNPLECVTELALWPQLCSPSVLRIKHADILLPWQNTTDLRPLRDHTDVRWRTMNVLGQVVSMLRESLNTTPSSSGKNSQQFINIPAACSSGVTLIIPKDSPGYEELKNYPELSFIESISKVLD